MAANTSQVFTLTPQTPVGKLAATGNTSVDLTSGTITDTGFVGGTNGSRLDRVEFVPKGTNVASVGRVWLTNATGAGVQTNVTLIGEITLPATTVSQIAALTKQVLFLGLPIPSGFKILVTIGTTVAAGFCVNAIGGDY